MSQTQETNIVGKMFRALKDSNSITGYSNVTSIDSGGMFTQPHQDGVISAVAGLMEGFDTRLPSLPTVIRNPQIQIITGIGQSTEVVGGDCEQLPVAADFTVGTINNYPMGEYGMASKPVKLDQLGYVDNDWTAQNQSIVGSPFANGMTATSYPSGMGNQYAMSAQSTVAEKLSALAISSSMEFGREKLYGDPAQNGNDGTSILHMRGIDSMIAEGYTDSVTGEALERADSAVFDFANQTVEGNGAALVELIIDIIEKLNYRSMLMGFGSTWNGFLVMSPDLFRKLSQQWAAKYYSYLTSLNTTSFATITAESLQDMRTMMENQRVLVTTTGLIPVVTDVSIINTDEGAGNYSSTIYFVPTTYMGRPATYTEFFPMDRMTAAQGAIEQMLGAGKYEIRTSTDGNRFLVWRTTNDTCLRINMKYHARMRLDTPFLAARIDNVQWALTMDGNGKQVEIYETPYPSDPSYLNGGQSVYGGANDTVRNITACADSAAGIVELTLDGGFDFTVDYKVYVVIGDERVPAKATVIDNTDPDAPVVTVDFTDPAYTSAFFATLTCGDLDFTSGQLVMPYAPQTVP